MATNTVSIPRAEYRDLISYRKRFERLQQSLAKHLFIEPPTRRVKEVMQDLEASKRHSPKLLREIERGLRESDYFS